MKSPEYRTSIRVMASALTVAMAMILGCAYPTVRPSVVDSKGIQPFIGNHYGQFDMAYSGDEKRPGAIRFDLKQDGISFTGRGWTPLQSRSRAEEMALYMNRIYAYMGNDAQGPRLYEIRDPKGSLLGYYYSPVASTPIRKQGGDYDIDPITFQDIEERGRPGLRGAGG
ncbi:MAG: hypothetical protein PVG99_14320 [Desulfobacteraceae bacterium]|jgi:hypothetical protein